jgi:hypothetical protein
MAVQRRMTEEETEVLTLVPAGKADLAAADSFRLLFEKADFRVIDVRGEKTKRQLFVEFATIDDAARALELVRTSKPSSLREAGYRVRATLLLHPSCPDDAVWEAFKKVHLPVVGVRAVRAIGDRARFVEFRTSADARQALELVRASKIPGIVRGDFAKSKGEIGFAVVGHGDLASVNADEPTKVLFLEDVSCSPHSIRQAFEKGGLPLVDLRTASQRGTRFYAVFATISDARRALEMVRESKVSGVPRCKFAPKKSERVGRGPTKDDESHRTVTESATSAEAGTLLYVYPKSLPAVSKRKTMLLQVEKVLSASAAPATLHELDLSVAVGVHVAPGDEAAVRATLATDASLIVADDLLPSFPVVSVQRQEVHIKGRIADVLRGMAAAVHDGGQRERAIVYFAPVDETAVRRRLEQQDVRVGDTTQHRPKKTDAQHRVERRDLKTTGVSWSDQQVSRRESVQRIVSDPSSAAGRVALRVRSAQRVPKHIMFRVKECLGGFESAVVTDGGKREKAKVIIAPQDEAAVRAVLGQLGLIVETEDRASGARAATGEANRHRAEAEGAAARLEADRVAGEEANRRWTEAERDKEETERRRAESEWAAMEEADRLVGQRRAEAKREAERMTREEAEKKARKALEEQRRAAAKEAERMAREEAEEKVRNKEKKKAEKKARVEANTLAAESHTAEPTQLGRWEAEAEPPTAFGLDQVNSSVIIVVVSSSCVWVCVDTPVQMDDRDESRPCWSCGESHARDQYAVRQWKQEQRNCRECRANPIAAEEKRLARAPKGLTAVHPSAAESPLMEADWKTPSGVDSAMAVLEVPPGTDAQQGVEAEVRAAEVTSGERPTEGNPL